MNTPDATGQEQLFSFDAWGQRRNALDWSELLYWDLVGFNTSITTRGFTGHEMLDRVGLIHMNGRIYHPALGGFLQADPFVQEPGYSQSYNRYAYVWNNPLNATDPSGYFRLREFVGTIVTIALTAAPWGSGFWATVAYGAIGGAAGAAANGGNILQGAAMGGVSSAAFYGVGTAFDGAPVGDFAGSGLTPEAFASKVLAHGLTGGVMSVLQGGKFGHGFASAGVTQAFSGAIGGIGGRSGSRGYYSAGNRFARIVAAATVGGTASKLSGGKFANGAATAAFSFLFSEMARGGQEEEPLGRALTTEEITEAENVFGDKIDYSKVRIIDGKFLPWQGDNYVMAPDGNIYWPGECGNLATCGGPGIAGVFIHEMTHVMQIQHGVNVLGRGLFLQAAKFLTGGLYDP